MADTTYALEDRLGISTDHHAHADELKNELLVMANALGETDFSLNIVERYVPQITDIEQLTIPQRLYHYKTKKENEDLFKGLAAVQMGKVLFETLSLPENSAYWKGVKGDSFDKIIVKQFKEDPALGSEVVSYVETKRVMQMVAKKFPGLKGKIAMTGEYLMTHANDWQKKILEGECTSDSFEDSLTQAKAIYQNLPKSKTQESEVKKVKVKKKAKKKQKLIVYEQNEQELAEEIRRYTFDEFDGSRKLKDHATVIERVADSTPNNFVESQTADDKRAIARTRKIFEQLKPPIYQRLRKQQRGLIDMKEVIAAHAAGRAGITPSDRLYYQIKIDRRNVATAVLLELSGSLKKVIDSKEQLSLEDTIAKAQSLMPTLDTKSRENIGKLIAGIERIEPMKLKKPEQYKIISQRFGQQIERYMQGHSTPNLAINVLQRTAYALCEAMDAIGDEFGIFAYSGRGNERVDMFVVKSFDEPYTDQVVHRIGNLEPLQQNRDGPALRYATKKIHEHAASKKLLLHLSDGKPEDVEYSHAYVDTRRALHEPKAKGIMPVCIIAGHSPHENLEEGSKKELDDLYKGINHIYVPDFAQLPSLVPTLYRKLTL